MEFNYEMEDGVDTTLSESGNSFLALRKIRWKETSNFKYDIRHYYIKNGKETYGKGCSLDEDACNVLPTALINEGFGDTEDILTSLKDREDFKPSLKRVISGEGLKELGIDPSTIDEEEYYDPAKEIFGEDDEECVE